MSMWTQYGVGDITAAESFIISKPKNYLGPKRAVIYCHGDEGTNPAAIQYLQYVQRSTLIASIANNGHFLLSADLGGNATWGNNTVIARITSAVNYMLLQGVSPGKITLLLGSMGTVGGYAWAAANLGLVSCVVGMLPVVDLTDVWANNRGGYTATINAAYGGAYSEAAFGAQHNPKTMALAGAYAGMPMQLWYGTTDAIVIPATVVAFQAAVGASCIAYPIVGGHAETTIGNIDLTVMNAFIDAHTA